MGGMDEKNPKAEYFREHAELLSGVARSLKPADRNRTRLLNMSYYFERLVEAAEKGGARRQKRQPLPRGIGWPR